MIGRLPHCVPISDESDVVVARARARKVALDEGLSEVAVESLVTAISELAWNIVVHAKSGEISLGALRDGDRRGVAVLAHDLGPGIADIDRAMSDGFTTGRGLGLGLSSARRLVDELSIASSPGRGTTVILKKWVP